MKATNLIYTFSLAAVFALVSCSKADQTQTNNPTAASTNSASVVASAPGDFSDPSKLTATAPDTFKAQFDTTKGKFTVEVTRSLAPNGADRFYNLVKSGYFTDVEFFRVVPGFMCQFGIHGDPAVSAKWRDANISDDPVKGSNTRGTITFATAGPNTRTTQLFINFADNAGSLDGQGFAPFGKVTEGMDVVDKINSEYGENPPDAQGHIQMEGNTYLKKTFPNLDYIKSATIVP
ncbi:MAG TPA: peptidylprolyl isomerase [Verrucomicrobiae bacterium]|nr:peptidylprolyl isomerase [Verrucomicrobiae bacterium]